MTLPRGFVWKKTRILIVDDEEAIREVVSTLLEVLGYDCSSVGNGRLAKEFLGSHQVDLVLSDMVMPEMDGSSLVCGVACTKPNLTFRSSWLRPYTICPPH